VKRDRPQFACGLCGLCVCVRAVCGREHGQMGVKGPESQNDCQDKQNKKTKS